MDLSQWDNSTIRLNQYHTFSKDNVLPFVYFRELLNHLRTENLLNKFNEPTLNRNSDKIHLYKYQETALFLLKICFHSQISFSRFVILTKDNLVNNDVHTRLLYKTFKNSPEILGGIPFDLAYTCSIAQFARSFEILRLLTKYSKITRKKTFKKTT